MTAEEAFRVLELPQTANAAEVERAYRELVKVWHPDRFNHDEALRQRAESKLKQLNEARTVALRGESSESQSSGAAPPYVDEQIRYHGIDPRLHAIGAREFGGRRARIAVAAQGVVLQTITSSGPDEQISVPVSDSLGVSTEELSYFELPASCWVVPGVIPSWNFGVKKAGRLRISYRDPAGVEKSLHAEISTRNAYHLEVLTRQLVAQLGLREHKPPRPAPVQPQPQKTSPPSETTSNATAQPTVPPTDDKAERLIVNVAVSICVVFGVLALWIVFEMAASHYAGVTPTASIGAVQFADTTSTESASPAQPAPTAVQKENPVDRPPYHSKTIRSFTVWTKPFPPPNYSNGRYSVFVRITLPRDVDTFRMADLNGSFVERLPKTTSGGIRRLEYRKHAPLLNATVHSLTKRIHLIEFEIDGALTNDTLNISSKMCGESAVFHLR